MACRSNHHGIMGGNLSMHDIRLALGLVGFLSIGIFLGVRRLLSFAPPRALDAVAVGLILLMAAYLKYVWAQLWIVKWIPLPSVIVLANWFPLMLGALGAVVWNRMSGEISGATTKKTHELSVVGSTDEHSMTTSSLLGRTLVIRRIVMMVVITGGAVWSELYFIPSSPPVCGNQWDPPFPSMPWHICRQTHNSTCSAAASATILASLDISTTEQEMAKLCLTRNGTTWLGLYHGLATKLTGTNYQVNFFECEIIDLPEMASHHPLLLCCKLDPAVARDRPEYATVGGWIPGTAHSVVYFGYSGRVHLIGDPSRGYELWNDRDLETLWMGQGLRIQDVFGPNSI
ncbi:MAG: hypothetical protein MK102_02100 [Fuerstiella sp.]|nr:hypothetical protein [Fuerstiella sp.]